METYEYIIDFYNNYDEDCRLTTKHGAVEFLTTMRYIEKHIRSGACVLEIGAGTGRYSHTLARQGYTVDAVELVNHNIEVFSENAFLDADYEVRGETFFDNESTIPLLFSFGLGPGGEAWPHIGSSASSMVDFWAGMGIMEIRENGVIVPRIISRTQFELIQNELIDVPVHTELSGKNGNYNNIFVYDGTLLF